MTKQFIDSNIIIRLIVKDQEDQFQKSKEIIQKIEAGKANGVISILVMGEIVWILEHYYDLLRSDFISKLLALLALKNIKIHEAKKDTLINVLQKMLDNKIDFTDIYLREIAKESRIISFDRDFNRMK